MTVNTENESTPHVGRSFQGHPLEDACPCPQEACGLIAMDKADPDCPEHGFHKAKTLRQAHLAEQCPDAKAEVGRE
jgi:hypothetical protein